MKGHNDEADACYFAAGGMFTYWNMTAVDAVVATVQASTVRTSTVIPKDYTRPGFKVIAELTLPPAMVDLDLEFTWFQNDDKRNSFTSVVLPAGSTFATALTTAGGSLANTFYRFDFTVDKELMFGEYLKLVPGGGLLGIWGKSWWNTVTINNAAPAVTFTAANTQSFWGVGPYADLCVEFQAPSWAMMENAQWVFFMKGGTGFTWTDKKMTYNVTDSAANSLIATDNPTIPQQMIDGSLGLKWEMMPNSDNTFGTWAFNVAWDFQWWPDLLVSDTQGTSFDMALQGLTTGLLVKF